MISISHVFHTILFVINHAFLPAAQQNPIPLLLVASYVLLNLALYFFTRGNEFAIGGFAATLFLVPFLNV